MIDLISHGLDLRKNILMASDFHPHEIRSISAKPIRYQATESAREANSATTIENNLKCAPENGLKIIENAESADLAEHQPIHTEDTADELRKKCGLNSVTFFKNQFNMVNCNNCEHFTPDRIGDGVGIGLCRLGIKFTKLFNGTKMPLYRYSDRYCDKFIKLISE